MSFSLELLVRGQDYLFYRIYLWQLEQWQDRDIAINSAGINIGVLVGANLLTVLNVISIFTHFKSFFDRSVLEIIIVVVIWCGLFNVLYRRRADSIISGYDFRKETNRKHQIFAWTYCLSTGILLVLSAVAGVGD